MSALEISAVEVTVPLASIRRDEALICRARGVNAATVKEYSAALKAGTVFPPVVVFRDPKGVHWLADGFHRTAAAELAGLVEIAADIRGGGRKEALLFAASANSSHGLRRTNADKRKAVGLLLAAYPKWSARKIGEAAGVDHKSVGSVRRKAEQSETGGEIPQRAFDAQREIARLERAILAVAERWPKGDDKGLAEFGARMMAMGTVVAPQQSPRRTAKAKPKTNGAAHSTTTDATA